MSEKDKEEVAEFFKKMTDEELMYEWISIGAMFKPLDYALWADQMIGRLRAANSATLEIERLKKQVAELEQTLDNQYAEKMGDNWYGRD